MLWFKIWCETRTRLAVAGIVLGIVAIAVVGWRADWRAAGDTPQTIFLVLASVLGGGSLRQERAHGTLGFTLALPVARGHHFTVRALAGIGEIAALAALVAALTRTPAVLALWTPCGVLAFAVALGAAALVASEYTGWLLGFGAVMAYEIALNLPAPRAPALDLYRIMGDGLVGAALPWASLAALVAAGLLVLLLADRAQRWRAL
jgi:hypothetical protein